MNSIDKESFDDWIEELVQTAKIVNPLIIVSDFGGLTPTGMVREATPAWDRRFLAELIKMGYEVRHSTFNLSDFGLVQVGEQATLSLVASKVGLPSPVLPRTKNKPEIAKKLLGLGYPQDYAVSGDLNKQLQLVEQVIPLPIGKEVAESIKNHVGEICELVNCARVQIPGHRKRKGDEEEATATKRARAV